MAEYNRNQRTTNRDYDRDWNESGRRDRDDDDRYYSTSGNRGYGNMNQEFDDEGSQWQSRYEREYNRGGYNSENYGRQYEGSDESYGRQRGYSRPWQGGGSRSRNLYDRDYEGMGRRGYSRSGTRIGGANYSGFGDRTRDYPGYGRQGYGSNYGSAYGSGGTYSSDYDRPYERDQNRDERTWWDRTTDEVSSWFGDEDAERRRDRDRQMSYRGKGPKNYNRSDERIKEDVNDRLADDPFIDATDIEVTVSNGEVTLMGMVDERSEKRRAEDLAESVSGVRNVENRLRTGRVSGSGNPQYDSGSTSTRSESPATSAVSGSERKGKTTVTG